MDLNISGLCFIFFKVKEKELQKLKISKKKMITCYPESRLKYFNNLHLPSKFKDSVSISLFTNAKQTVLYPYLDIF